MEQKAIVCDPGTGYMKMGYAGDNFPRTTFASLVGRPMLRSQQILGQDVKLKEIMIGAEAQKYRSLLELSHPTSEGIVKHWDDMQILMEYSFQSIGVNDPRNKSVFITQALLNPISNKIGMMQLMFEKFHVNRIQYGIQAIMSLFAEGLMTALLLDCGDGVSHCIPVFQGQTIKHSCQRLEIAGRHITTNLIKLLNMKGYAFNSSSDFELVRQIKQKYCFMSGEIKVDKKLALQTCIHDKIFTLPDGQNIKIGKERFMAPEILMDPIQGGFQLDGCAQMVFKSINACDMNLKRDFYRNILISGGTSMLPGFPTRLKQDVKEIFNKKVSKGASSTIKIRVKDTPTRRYNVFIGASLQAQISQTFPKSWSTKQEYQQKGKDRMAQQLSKNL